MSTTNILEDKWKEIEARALVSGQGDLEKGLCVMQAVDYISSGGFSDHPACACPLLTIYAISINDRFNDEDRQKLKPLIPLLVGTRSDNSSIIARKRFILWRNVTFTYPALLDFIKADEHAKALRALSNTNDGMAAAATYLKENREAIRKIADADAYTHAHVHADAYAHVHADADAYAYDDTYADADAYTHAHKKLRSTLADIAVETLRLAILVKP